MDRLAIPAGAVACRRLAINTRGVRMPTDEISHLLAIAQTAARVVAQVECLGHAHTRACRISGTRMIVGGYLHI